MQKVYLKSALALAVATATTPVLANGLALNEQSASSAGTSYAGRASTVHNASTIYGNPAGLSRLEQAQISVGAAFISADTDIDHARGLFPGTNKGDMVPDSTVPFAYFATPLNEKVAVGIGMYVPFGVESDYGSRFQGRLHGLHSLVKVVTIQPTLSYQINDRIAIGGGPTFSRIDGKLTNAIPGAVFAQQLGQPALAAAPDTRVNIEGDDQATGYNLGVLVALSDNLDWGITYHSKLQFHLNGNTDIAGSRQPAARPRRSLRRQPGDHHARVRRYVIHLSPGAVDSVRRHHLDSLEPTGKHQRP